MWVLTFRLYLFACGFLQNCDGITKKSSFFRRFFFKMFNNFGNKLLQVTLIVFIWRLDEVRLELEFHKASPRIFLRALLLSRLGFLSPLGVPESSSELAPKMP